MGNIIIYYVRILLIEKEQENLETHFAFKEEKNGDRGFFFFFLDLRFVKVPLLNTLMLKFSSDMNSSLVGGSLRGGNVRSLSSTCCI